MYTITVCFRRIFILLSVITCSQTLMAHNGKLGFAYPLNNIKIDGDLSDWPANITTYRLANFMSETKPKSDADFSGFFQVGYNLANQSLYLALSITDDEFIEDSSKNVRWNTQDGLELSIDARHQSPVSGVASFLYSKHFKNVNKSHFDPFGSSASWDIMEVVMKKQGNLRIYEWRVILGNQLEVGKTIGLDFNVFDLDSDKSFSFASWGKGEEKYRNPNSLADILLLPAKQQTGRITGRLAWDKSQKTSLPRTARLYSTFNNSLWVATEVDSSGNYSVEIPTGEYEVKLAGAYFHKDKKVYAAVPGTVSVVSRKGRDTKARDLLINSTPVPSLINAKGVLLNYTAADSGKIDEFIETYQKYYNIPGVSLALIKDGKLVYHKTYGVRNTFTLQPVDDNTLFEAASITKPVFAFAVQRLAERGVIDLNKPLWEYLPYKDIEHDERYKAITGKHVLTHRTGFPNWRWMNPDGKLDLKFPPDSTFGYSGEGFEYLKLVVEKITGKKVEQVLREEVIEPMGLWHTFFSRNDSLRRMAAEGHNDLMPNYDELNEIPGMAWSMQTEAKIFTNYMLYLLEQKGLNESSYTRMFSKHSEYPFPPEMKPPYPVYMGMSLQISETPFGKSFAHGGNNGDFRCRFEVYKDLKAGYAIFTNSNTSEPLLDVFRQFLVEGSQDK